MTVDKSIPQRKYALTKVGPGDYILPDNDRNFWRIAKYEDGPSSGLDWPRDREFWGAWEWSGWREPHAYEDPTDWDLWMSRYDMLDTRQEAIEKALRHA